MMPAVLDRHPPNAIEVEQGILGCILLAPSDCMDICAGRVATSEIFYDMRHQHLYDVLAEMHDKRELIDPISVQQQLRDRNQLEALGGMSYIAGLMNCVPSAANLEYYLDIVERKFALRSLIQRATRIVSKAYNTGGEDEYVILAEAEKEIMAIGDAAKNEEGDEPIKQTMGRVIDRLESAHQNQGKIRFLQTGFPDLDKITHGFKPGQMIVIAGRPGDGKTSLAMNIAEFVAVDSGIPVGIFSLEMPAEELLFRMTCSRAEVDSDRAEKGNLSSSDFTRLANANTRISRAPIHICERGGLSIQQLSARARRMVQRYGIKLFVIDYLQLMSSRNRGNRNDQITEISNGVKGLAKDLKVPVVVLSQFSREVEKQDRAPRMSDLRDSGSIEQDADIIGLLNPKAPENGVMPERQEVNLLLPKHRGGKVGFIRLIFNRPLTRYESVSPIEPDYQHRGNPEKD